MSTVMVRVNDVGNSEKHRFINADSIFMVRIKEISVGSGSWQVVITDNDANEYNIPGLQSLSACQELQGKILNSIGQVSENGNF